MPLFAFDNTYARELPGAYVAWPPAATPAPKLLFVNRMLAARGAPVGGMRFAHGTNMYSWTSTRMSTALPCAFSKPLSVTGGTYGLSAMRGSLFTVLGVPPPKTWFVSSPITRMP